MGSEKVLLGMGGNMSENSGKGTVVLVAFYNKKALGVRYLETALKNDGYEVYTIFFKDFNSIRPRAASEEELRILCGEILKVKPVFAGLSVMSSMYLETVYAVIGSIKSLCRIPVVCGGAFSTMFPERMLNAGADYVIRGDGEIAICRLADMVRGAAPLNLNTPSVCFRADGESVAEDIVNDIGDILADIDGYGLPMINSKNACYIENDMLVRGDPQLDTLSYEVIASRGCPFTCSYCCCINLRRLLPRGIKTVRTRSVKSVIDELKIAKQECKKMVVVHFYDEIFPNTPGWVDEFVVEYRKYINLPFIIWSHPKMVNVELLKKLKKVGLMEVIMGIQSGSEHIRRDVFHRYETQQDIIAATKAIKDAGIFWATYDFMLQHAFESLEDLKQTYRLVKKLHGRFELQMHGLNYLPGTDIVEMAINEGFFTEQQLEEIMYDTIENQFGAYWQAESSMESQLWYKLTFCLQFPIIRRMAEKLEDEKILEPYRERILRMHKAASKLAKLRYIYKKGRVVLRQFGMKINRFGY